MLEELLSINPPQTARLKLNHLGTLFGLDSSLSGKFTLDNLLAFADMYRERAAVYRVEDFEVIPIIC